MAHTVVGAFQDTKRAREAVQRLEAKGFSDKEVSLVGPDDRGHGDHDRGHGGDHDRGHGGDHDRGHGGDHDRGHGGDHHDTVADGTAWGAGIGGAAGLLAAAGAIAIPGVGPLIAAGPLAATLTGAAAGGLGGAFVDAGIPAASSKRYEDEVKRGHAVVTVHADGGRSDEARSILQAQGAHDIEVD